MIKIFILKYHLNQYQVLILSFTVTNLVKALLYTKCTNQRKSYSPWNLTLGSHLFGGCNATGIVWDADCMCGMLTVCVGW